MQEITSIEQFEELSDNGKSIVMFTANWCPDCIVIKPFLPEIIEKYSEFNFYMVNRDNLMDLCVQLDIFGIPSFVAFNEGKETGRFVSKDRKTKEEIEKFIESMN